ncbi:MAG: hypothetical protein IKF19_05100 [Bacilli bacterium]|nr:hypothetical protein [Bacilli bacterium]
MKSKKMVKLLIEAVIIVFIFSYAIEKSGYYEYNLQEKKNMTEDEIKKFENDVKMGKNVDVKDYLNDVTKDYSSNLTRSASTFSLNLNRYLIKTINETINIFSKLVK